MHEASQQGRPIEGWKSGGSWGFLWAWDDQQSANFAILCAIANIRNA
jgi:hypothetical protein